MLFLAEGVNVLSCYLCMSLRAVVYGQPLMPKPYKKNSFLLMISGVLMVIDFVQN